MTADETFVAIQTEDLDIVVSDEDPTLAVVCEDATAAVVLDGGTSSDAIHMEIATDSMDLVVEQTPAVDVVVNDVPQPVIVEGSVGPRGPQGPSGSMTFEGTAWWTGEGPPGTIVGSKPGDEYIDTLTGTVYKLEVS